MMPQLLAHLFGDYLLQSDWMAQNKTKASWPALCHALLYSLCFVPLCWQVAHWDYSHACVTTITLSGAQTPCGEVKPLEESSLYALRPESLTWTPQHFRWLPWLVILGSHFLIDRFRLARYVVWAKNFIGPRRMWLERRDYKNGKEEAPFLLADLNEDFNYTTVSHSVVDQHWINPPLHHCPTGYPSITPIWLSTWLLIIADNTLHLAINWAALRWL